MKVKTVIGGGKIFFCPGCNSPHSVNGSGPRWAYNGDAANPTFSPSILVTYDGRDADAEDGLPSRCHSFVREGQIQFLGDCTHALAGQTVLLPDWPYALGEYGGVVD